MLRAWLRNHFKSENDIDDLLQETYLRLLKAKEQSDVTSPKAFIFTVARNLALDRLRHREVLPTISLVVLRYFQWVTGRSSLPAVK
jgi:RNA polymerase sigma-70 factor (ECF subfamily)